MPPIRKHLTHLKYRADVDGLRAIAVLSVVLFHGAPGKFPGGFIGVDIFFVISGFLISSIIFSNLEQDTFSIVRFYDRRIRRVFPALITVMLISLVFGWFALLADEYKQLGKHIAGGAGFISNFVLWRESGYFDNTAESKLMLHLWSLAIEEQFYIFWPLLLGIVWKLKLNFLLITTVITIISFVANIYVIGRNPTSAFYSPIPRFWELMIGGVLAYIALHRPEVNSKLKNVQSLIGFALLVIGLLLINKAREFPGWWALLPTVGTFFLISAGSAAYINEKILSHKIMVWFGMISYPLYLWHWPLLSFARIIEGEPSLETRAALILASVFLAWLTYKVIEQPLRFGEYKRTAFILVFALFVTGLLGYSCLASNGYQGSGFRDLDEKERIEYSNYFENGLPDWQYFEREKIPDKHRNQCNWYNTAMYRLGKSTNTPIEKIDKECYTRDSNIEFSLLIWGDSHASQLYYGLHKNLPNNWQILQTTSAGCIPNISSPHDSITNYCDKSNWFALETIKSQRPNVVIVAQNLGHDVEKMSSIGSHLELLGVKTVIFTGPTPHWTIDLPRIIVRKLWKDTPRKTFVGIDNEIIKVDQMVKHKFTPSLTRRFVSMIDYFCDENGCLTYIGNDKKSGTTSYDRGHLTPVASDAFAKYVLVPLIVTPIDMSLGSEAQPNVPADAQKAARR